MGKKLVSFTAVLLCLLGCLCGCTNRLNLSPTEASTQTAVPTPTQTPVIYPTPTVGASDVSVIKEDNIERLEGMFAGGTKIWYEYAEDCDAPDKYLTQKSFDLDEDKFKLYEHLFNCTWERGDSADADDSGAVVFIGDDDKGCFRFYLGSDIVAYIDGEETEYYRAYIEIEEDYFPDYPRALLPKVIMQEFSGYERFANRVIYLKADDFESKEDIAYAFMELQIAYLKAMTPENWYSLADYQILELSLSQSKEDKFIFCVKPAIKPKVYENSIWFAGSGEAGKGEWAGYIIRNDYYRLDLINGYWEARPCSSDTRLNEPVTYPTPTVGDSDTSAKTNVTVIEQDGISIAFPSEYCDLLLFNPEENFYHEAGALVEVYYKPTYGKSGAGWLFSIVRYNQAQYEQYLSGGDAPGRFFFAKDDTYYYGYFRPTDVQHFDQNDMVIFNDLKYNLGDFVRQDILTRNNLTPYSDNEFWSKTYTYDSDHVYLTYYPYYAYQDTAAQQNFSWQDVAYTLVLSQPAAQGDTGIWCVERMYDDPKYGYIYVHFPNTEGLSAAEYYAKLQEKCDMGQHSELLDPVQVALNYVKLVHGHSAATIDSFVKAEGLPEGDYRH